MAADDIDSNARTGVLELAKHCRLVHFTLVVVCCIIAISSRLDPSGDVQRASEDLIGILSIRHHWDTTDFLLPYLDRTRGLRSAQLSDSSAGMPHDLPELWLRTWQFFSDTEVKPQFFSDMEVKPCDQTLEQFIKLWNWANKIRVVSIEHSEVAFVLEWQEDEFSGKWGCPKSLKVQLSSVMKDRIAPAPVAVVSKSIRETSDILRNRRSILKLDPTSSLPLSALLLRDIFDVPDFNSVDVALTKYKNDDTVKEVMKYTHIQFCRVGRPRGEVFGSGATMFGIGANVSSEASDPDAQAAMKKLRRVEAAREEHTRWRREWRSGSFEYTFPELSKLTESLTSLQLTQVGEHLEGEARRSPEGIGAFGFSFPARAVRQWGMGLILGIYLYFVLHLARLRSRIKRRDLREFVEARTPWIGLYADPVSKLTVFLTSVGLPLFVCALIGLDTLHYEPSSSTWQAPGFLGVYTLGLFAASIWWDIWGWTRKSKELPRGSTKA